MDEFDRIYQYDPLGWVIDFGEASDTGWFSNVFTSRGTSEENEVLEAVSFYVPAASSTYSLEVWIDGTIGSPRSGTKVAEQSGVLDIPGYRTVRLESPVALSPGIRFAVVVRLTTPGYLSPIALELPMVGYSDKATAEADQSYVSSDGNIWEDLTSVASYEKANTCLKAFTRSARVRSGKSITGFSLPKQVGDAVLDDEGHTVAVTVKYGTDMTSMAATFGISSGASATVGGVMQISGTTVNDFSSPLVYRVTAEDGSYLDWTVTVTSAPAPKTGKAFTDYSLPGQISAPIDGIAHLVWVTMPYGTVLGEMAATFEISEGAEASIGWVKQISGRTLNDFSSPVTYLITAEDGSSQEWTVNAVVAPAPRSDKDFTSYCLPGQIGDSSIDTSEATVSVDLEYGTDISALAASFDLSGGAFAAVGGIEQISGVTVNDFTSPVVYTVTAEDGSSRPWTVSTAIAPRTGKSVISYSLPGQRGVHIDGERGRITVNMPEKSDLSSAVATFELSGGASATVGGVDQISGITANDLGSPVVYRITAEDGSYRDWTVVVTGPVTVEQVEARSVSSDVVSSDTGAKPLSTADTADLVNGNSDLVALFESGHVESILAASLSSSASDIGFTMEGGSHVSAFRMAYDGGGSVTPLVVRMKDDGADRIDRFDISLSGKETASAMKDGVSDRLTFRFRVVSGDMVVMFHDSRRKCKRNLIAEKLASSDQDGAEHVLTFSVSDGSEGLTFEDLGGSEFDLQTEAAMVEETLTRISGGNYVYQDLVNLGISNLDPSKWNEYKSRIDGLSSPTLEDIQAVVTSVNEGGASGGSSGGGCSVGYAPALFILGIPLLSFLRSR
ncbi:MAG: lectin like domain-containing protein [Synergistota bacterium]|nr:lectin like domain-containing protein [Synergistota bacterium]